MTDLLLGVYAASLKDIEGLVADIDDARMAEQPAGVRNHPAWTIGHLVFAAGGILGLLEEPSPAIPATYASLFSFGTRPTSDRAAYPPKAELLELLRAQHAAVEAAMKKRETSLFDAPSPERLRGWAPTRGTLITYLLTAHEHGHNGQLIAWRRAAGIAKG